MSNVEFCTRQMSLHNIEVNLPSLVLNNDASISEIRLKDQTTESKLTSHQTVFIFKASLQ